MRLTLTVHELEAFLLVAETKNFRTAAERAHLSQSALSRRIQSAEQKLDTRLFDRTTHWVELTDSGRELVPIATRIISEFSDSLSDLSEFIAGRKGNISVFAMPSAAAAILPAAIRTFQNSHPLVRIAVQPVAAGPVLRAVVEGSADFGISTAPSQEHTEIEYERLLYDEFVLICPSGDALASHSKVRWAVFAKRPFIASGATSSIRFLTDRVFASAGLSITPRYESANISVLGAMVAGGVGIAAVPRLALRLVDTARIAIVPLVDPTASRQIGILTRKRRSLSAAATRFLDTLRSHREDWVAAANEKADTRQSFGVRKAPKVSEREARRAGPR